MSWSVNFMGKPANIITALQKESDRLTGDSKKEYEACLPNLKNLVQLNFNKDEQHQPVLHLTANGHSFTKDDQPQYGTCFVSLQPISGLLV